MIDLHAHILPGLDDGPRDMEEAAAMARQAEADGIKAVAAAPHVLLGVYNNSRESILRAVQALNAELAERNINLKVYPGAEYMLDPDLPAWLSKGEALTINGGGKYLLVELPAAYLPNYTMQTLYEISLQGVTTVIAHPERNASFIEDPGLMNEFMGKNVLFQVTAGSLTGMFGRRIMQTARYCLLNGFCHLIGSDGHNISRRPVKMSAAAQRVAEDYGVEHSSLLTGGNPARILGGRQALEPGKAVDRRNVLKRLFGR